MPQSCVIGSLNYDMIIRQPRFAEKGETLTADAIWQGGGGKGANQAVQLAKLGVPTFLIGAVGSDIYGDLLLKELASYGVDLSGVALCEGNSGMGIINSTPDGSVTASILPGANFLLSPRHIDQNLKIINKSDIILYQLEVPLSIIQYSLKQGRGYTILNAAPAVPLPSSLWDNIDCLIVNEVEASFYAERKISTLNDAFEALKKLREILPKKLVIIITLGGDGSLVSVEDRVEHIPALKVIPVETTGAGDSFIGAFAAFYLKSSNVLDSVEFGTKAASLTVQGLGAQSSMPTLQQIMM